MNNNAVGVFDSGLGGLCAVREILKILPGENIIYFGDTGRVPYGNKSYETIKKYGRQSVNFLLSKNVKIILIACGTVSSAALEELRSEYKDVPILGVIESACEKAVEIAGIKNNKKIGVIGTQATVSRGAFEKYIHALDNSCEVYGQACPLFVPLVENGHLDDEITRLAAEKYLGGLRDLNLSSLILGCTHYPMIKNIIGGVIDTELIDAGVEAAHRLKREMTEKNLLTLLTKKKGGRLEIFISDEGMNFPEIASAFLGFDAKSRISKVNIEEY
jgi:glutamate racemase